MRVLIFHEIVDEKINVWADIKLDKFVSILKLIKDEGYVASSIRDAQNHSKSIVFTFDDGYKSDYELVLPLLLSYGFTATFFIVTSKVGSKGYMNWEDIIALHKSGMEIGSHSSSHPFMSTISDKKLKFEMEDSKQTIETKLKTRISAFAYPFGDFSTKTNTFALEAGYKKICSSRPGLLNVDNTFLNRNSIHSELSNSQIKKIIFGGKNSFYSKILFYLIIKFLKSIMGIDNYLKLKDRVFFRR